MKKNEQLVGGAGDSILEGRCNTRMGNQLQTFKKNGVAPPPGSYSGVYLSELSA